MRGLLRKEWREHRWPMLAMLVLVALGQAVALLGAANLGSPLVAFQKILVLMAPLMALLLVNHLVVREYMGRTQLFLETLPVSRSQVLALKWLLGAALLWLTMAACFGTVLLFARAKVLLTPHFIGLVALRASAFVLFVYAFAFVVGLTGRYRYIIWSLLLVCVTTAETSGQLAPANWPPFYLVNEAMVYERLQLPLSSVLITGAITLALVAATFALALCAEGSLVVALSRRMSSRGKSAVIIACLGVIMASSIVEARKAKPPFALQDAVRSSAGPAVAVGIAGPPEQARMLANLLAADLSRLQAFLDLADAPALTALPDDALDGDAFQRAALPNADGVVVRAAFTNSQFDRDGFRAYALASWLQWHARGRSAQEDRRWLLDGAAQWLVAQGTPRQDTLALRAAFAARLLQARQIEPSTVLSQWLSMREQLGPCLSDALAWRMVASMAQTIGTGRFQSLSRSVLAQRPPGDARVSLADPGFAALLAQAGAPDQSSLARQFGQLFHAEQGRLAGPLGAMPIPQASFSANKMEGKSFEVHYQLGQASTAAGEGAPFSIRYLALAPWQGEIPDEMLARLDTTRSGVLPASFLRGTRVFTAVEQYQPLLGCSVRLAARRWEVQ